MGFVDACRPGRSKPKASAESVPLKLGRRFPVIAPSKRRERNTRFQAREGYTNLLRGNASARKTPRSTTKRRYTGDVLNTKTETCAPKTLGSRTYYHKIPRSCPGDRTR